MARGYRFGVVGNLSTVPNGSTVLPTDDIQIWLKCASIKDKAYTTLSQVLADSTTLQALITSPNAVDYMVRSTTWASGVTTDSGAMTLIGANNYASNTLLGNSTWLNAICNSTYFESVLNVKVPTMTSDSLPSGTCAADSISSAETASYKAFDNDATTFWSSNPTGTPGQHYNGYTFTAPQKIKMVVLTSFKNAQSSSDFEIKISSHDGGIWTDVSESFTFANTADSTTRKFAFVNDTAYSNYAVRFPVDCTAFSGQYIAQARTIQFYGRADV